MINIINSKKNFNQHIILKNVVFILAMVLFFTSCTKVSEKHIDIIDKAVKNTNSINKYEASFVLEVTELHNDKLVMFVQGSYSIDKNDTEFQGPVMVGEIVQTVFETPTSMKIAFYDDTYVTVSKDYKILSDMDKDYLLNQFMCAPSLSFEKDFVEYTEYSDVSNGAMYTIKAKSLSDDHKTYFGKLLGDDIYTFSKMKKPQKSLTEYSDILIKYVISPDNTIISRDTNYKITAYDSVPYFPAYQPDVSDYKREFSVSLTFKYKSFDNINTDITDFLPDTSQEEK